MDVNCCANPPLRERPNPSRQFVTCVFLLICESELSGSGQRRARCLYDVISTWFSQRYCPASDAENGETRFAVLCYKSTNASPLLHLTLTFLDPLDFLGPGALPLTFRAASFFDSIALGVSACFILFCAGDSYS